MLCYQALNRVVLDAVPADARRVLDVGCGSGTLGGQLAGRGVNVTGITFSEAEARVAREALQDVVTADLNQFQFEDLGQFDCVICSHVLEHLYEPTTVLRRLRAVLAPGGVLIVALPNIVHWRPRLKLIAGRFRYTSGGIMDSTHFRFFDRHSAVETVRDAGFDIAAVIDDGFVPLRGFRSILPGVAKRIDRLATRLRPGLFAWQFVILARLPDSDRAVA